MSTIDAEWETMSYTNRLRWWINNVWNGAPAAAPAPVVESTATPEPTVAAEPAVTAESVVEPSVPAESATLTPEHVPAEPVSAALVPESATPTPAPEPAASATPEPVAPATESKKHKKHWNKRTVNIQH